MLGRSGSRRHFAAWRRWHVRGWSHRRGSRRRRRSGRRNERWWRHRRWFVARRQVDDLDSDVFEECPVVAAERSPVFVQLTALTALDHVAALVSSMRWGTCAGLSEVTMRSRRRRSVAVSPVSGMPTVSDGTGLPGAAGSESADHTVPPLS